MPVTLYKLLTFAFFGCRRARAVRFGAALFFYTVLGAMTLVFVSASSVRRDNDNRKDKLKTQSFQSIAFNSTRVLDHTHDRSCLSVTRQRADWASEPLPDICSKIINFPQPFRKNCTKDDKVPGTPTCDKDQPMMFAQYGEDYFLYTRHFVHMTKPGFYLDLAANHPISISNTYFLDRCLGWSGICIEGNSKYFEYIHRERSCALVPTCVSAKDGESVEFMLSGPGSGIVKTHRHGSHVFDQQKRVERKKCVTLRSQIRRFGHTDIDYLNLDIEGGELNALKSIDWDVTRIKIISVEIAHKTEKEIDDFLKDKGFNKIDTLAEVNGIPGMPIYQSNRFYVHSSGVFGQPW